MEPTRIYGRCPTCHVWGSFRLDGVQAVPPEIQAVLGAKRLPLYTCCACQSTVSARRIKREEVTPWI